MKLWTYGQVRQKIEADMDLEDETFIKPNELAGYCNEAIDAAEAEIMKINEDYFLTRAYLAMNLGQTEFPLPDDMYAQKIRGLLYNDGSLLYGVKRIRGSLKFDILMNMNQFRPTDYYAYILMNGVQGAQSTIELVPPSRETAAASAKRLTLYYIRNAKRVPLIGEFTNRVDFTGDMISGSPTDAFMIPNHGLKSGDVIHIEPADSTTPAFGAAGTLYWVTVISTSEFKVSTSLLDYKLGNFLSFSSGNSDQNYYFDVQVDQTIQDATVLDIPEFTSFLLQFMKVRCYEKEPDPRYDAAVQALIAHQKQMIDTLTERTPDNDNTVELDLSAYREHN